MRSVGARFILLKLFIDQMQRFTIQEGAGKERRRIKTFCAVKRIKKKYAVKYERYKTP